MSDPVTGTRFPDFRIKDFDSRLARQDRMLAVIAWSLHSKASQYALPYWERLAEANPDALVVGICDGAEDEVSEWCLDNQIRFQQLSGDENVFQQLSAEQMPTCYLTDSSGTLLVAGQGWNTKTFEEINRYLANWSGVSVRSLVRPIDGAPDELFDE